MTFSSYNGDVQMAYKFVYSYSKAVYVLRREKDENGLSETIIRVEKNLFADMDKLAKPQIICHIEKSVDYSLFDVKWIPCSAKFVVMGSRPRGTGIIQIYEVSSGELKLVKDIERSNQMNKGTFKSSSLRDRHLATGDFKVSFTLTDIS